jgi:hypothetical protein
MSTRKTVITHAAQAIRLEELRRQQAEQAVRERQRLGVAHAEIRRLDSRYRELVAQLDQSARRLPDLHLQAPQWLELDSSDTSLQRIERHVVELRALVDGFGQRLGKAVRDAQAALAQRLALAAAWRSATALEQAVQAEHQNLAVVLDALHEALPALAAPVRPSDEASLTAVDAYAQHLERMVNELSAQRQRAQRRQVSQHHAQALAGASVAAGQGALAALEAHAAKLRQQARDSLEASLAQALSAAGLSRAELPDGTQTLMHAVLDAEEASPVARESIHRLVARERVLNLHAEQAQALMMAPPDLVHAKPSRARRWQTLVGSLQAVCNGLEPLSPVHQQEYEQIQADAQRDLDRSFVQAEFAQALREQDLLAQSTESGSLVIEDLRHLGVCMEESDPLEFTQGERGGMATVLELKTDSPLPPAREAAVVDDVCQRLQAAARSMSHVKTTCVELEHKRSIPRSRRPAGLKRFRAAP